MASRRGAAAACAILALALGCDGEAPTAPSPSAEPAPPPPDEMPAGEAAAATIFVSPDGNDAADGRTPETALRTLTRAVALARPGDTIELLPGVYAEEVVVEGGGDEGAPLTIRGPSTGTAVLDGEGRRSIGLLLLTARDVVVAGLEVRGFSGIGVAAWRSDRVTLRDLRVHDNGFDNREPDFEGEGFGIDVEDSTDVLVERCETYRNGPGPAARARGILGTGINTFGNRRATLRENHSHDNVGGGILVEDSFDVLVEGNLVEGNDLDVSAFGWWDGGLWVDGGGDVVVRDNVFRANRGPGIEISDEEASGPTGYVLEGNVSRGNVFGIYIWGFGACPFPPEPVLRLAGNDFGGNERLDVWCEER